LRCCKRSRAIKSSHQHQEPMPRHSPGPGLQI
jgi:hypothetical protein